MSVYIKGMDMPVDCLACRIACDKENYGVIGRPPKCPLEEAKTGDLISRADAVKTIHRHKHRLEGRGQTYGFLLEEFENRIPSAEAVEVVRCKDCKHRYMDGDVTHYYWCRLHDRPVDDTDYCAWGEERGEE